MNAFRQVAHIVWKDVREARWMIGAVLSAGIVSYATTVGFSARQSELTVTLGLISFVLSAITIATIVQQDSPVQRAAFWITHPVRPTALMIAKMVGAIGAVSLTTVMVESALAIHFGEMGNAGEFVVRALSGLLVFNGAAFVVGAVTPNLKTFTLAALATIAVMALIASPSQSVSTPVQIQLVAWRNVVQIGTAVVFVAAMHYVFAHRDLNLKWLVPCVVIVVPFAVIPISNVIGAPEFLRNIAPSSIQASVALHIDSMPTRVIGRSPRTDSVFIGIPVRMTGDTISHRFALYGTEIAAVTTGNSLIHFRVSSEFVNLNTLRSPIDGEMQWLDVHEQFNHTVGVSVPGSVVAGSFMLKPFAKVTLTAQMVVFDAELIATLPINADSAITVRASSYRVTSSEQDAERVWTVKSTGISRIDNLGSQRDSVEFALVNGVRHEAMHLIFASGTGSYAQFSINDQSIGDTEMELRLPPNASGLRMLSRPDDNWYREAQLQIVRWIPKYSYPVRVEYTPPK